MPKTMKNCFYKKLTFEKLLEAHYRASKGKRSESEIIEYEIDLETNLIGLLDKIKNDKYELCKYREFIIKDPKERVIRSLPYKDRIVHQWYVEEFIKPFFVSKFIEDSYACLEGKGVHRAIDKLQKYMCAMKKKYNDYYIIKMDIKKFFYSIDRDILFDILKRYIIDKKLLSFSRILLKDEEVPIGIPIGNYTSQYFANIYLNELDHYVKEKLNIKYYVRYMDDFVALVNTKETAKDVLDKIRVFLKERLNLELNIKSRYYPSKLGIDFCGYKIYETHRLLRRRFKIKMKKRIKLWNHLNSINKLNVKKMQLSWNSMFGHTKHANSHNFIEKMRVKKYEEIEMNKD